MTSKHKQWRNSFFAVEIKIVNPRRMHVSTSLSSLRLSVGQGQISNSVINRMFIICLLHR